MSGKYPKDEVISQENSRIFGKTHGYLGKTQGLLATGAVLLLPKTS